jgi:hypothetical protein
MPPGFWDRKLKDARPFRLANPATLKSVLGRANNAYMAKYLYTGRVNPVFHFCVFAGVFHYTENWLIKHKYKQQREYH